MINFDKFTNYSQEIIFASNAKKDFYKNTEVQPEHIMIAMIEDNGIAKDYLEELYVKNIAIVIILGYLWYITIRENKKYAQSILLTIMGCECGYKSFGILKEMTEKIFSINVEIERIILSNN